METLDTQEAHQDYVRSIDCHPTQRLLLSSSDDYTIKLWEYSDGGKLGLKRTYSEHQNFVMCVRFNPKDSNYFASGSLDTYIKVWSTNTDSSNFTLKDHTHAVNSLAFDPQNSNILASASDDKTIRIWDLMQRKCLYVLDGVHLENVVSVAYHPEMPYIISASEDKTVVIWSTNTMKKIQVVNYCKQSFSFELDLQRCWALATNINQPKFVAIGYDEGTMVIKFGDDEKKATLT